MVEQGLGGRIVNVTSVHEHVPRAGSSAYCSAKAALGMMAKTLALELTEHGILVNSVAPGEIATDMTGKQTEEAFETDRPGNPVGRAGHMNEVASVIGLPRLPEVVVRHRVLVHRRRGLMLMAAHGRDLAAEEWRDV
jgi:NAD(P)-dependent dehydrogenase (short-subunit alcohol dehydrogenase family)